MINKTTRLCLLALVFVILPHACIAILEDDEGPPRTHAVKREPIVRDIVIPEIAKGHEDIYRRFLMGKLIYKPDPKSDKGIIELLISSLANSLEGTFDLSRCGDTGKHLSISTGYRKGRNAESANKVEVWIVPRFLIEKNLETSAIHFKPIMEKWNADTPVGVFWTWGGWDNLQWYDYLITQPLDVLSDNNLCNKWQHAILHDPSIGYRYVRQTQSLNLSGERVFHVSFLN